jgi:hypothetical protein
MDVRVGANTASVLQRVLLVLGAGASSRRLFSPDDALHDRSGEDQRRPREHYR